MDEPSPSLPRTSPPPTPALSTPPSPIETRRPSRTAAAAMCAPSASSPRGMLPWLSRRVAGRLYSSNAVRMFGETRRGGLGRPPSLCPPSPNEPRRPPRAAAAAVCTPSASSPRGALPWWSRDATTTYTRPPRILPLPLCARPPRHLHGGCCHG